MMRLQRSEVEVCVIAGLQIENANPQEVAALWPPINAVSACDRLRYFLRFCTTPYQLQYRKGSPKKVCLSGPFCRTQSGRFSQA